MTLKHLHDSRSGSGVTVLARCLLLLPAAIVFTACAGTPDGSAQANANEECTYVRVTGSNLPVKQCRTVAEREAIAAQNRADADETFRQARILEETGDAALGADSLP